ncbi:gem-associated protein 6 [Nasonia vitripennis]|uniref:AD domain-containing protein n=1 Tax=Nasonia vitripennis TaxID=7425 RepID=A0A7M7G3I8_NASVI|nr:gem-associated protein 6 [Nasonia vitripennis]
MSTHKSDDSTNSLHKIYTNDPILFKSYVNEKVTITTEDSNVHTGIVYTVDPVSESVVLMQPVEGEEKMKMKILMRPAIQNIECSFDTKVILPEMFVPPPNHYSQEELLRRKNSVMKLLIENRFPITEDKGVLCIEETVRIEPPYGPENCICLNSIVLNRIQTILNRVSK